MRAHYVEYVIQEQSSFTLWRTLLCERVYESAKRMPHAKMVEVLNSIIICLRFSLLRTCSFLI